MNSTTNNLRSKELLGVILGIGFCFLSGAFDVYVSNISQQYNPIIIAIYCFISSTVVFGFPVYLKDHKRIMYKICENFELVFLLNISVLMSWIGLFYALKFLEPAVVAIVSVAVGPNLTLLISLMTRVKVDASRHDKLLSSLVLSVVVIMLVNSFWGNSGVSGTSSTDRIYGVMSLLICGTGMVSYTMTSKALSARAWLVSDLLAVRNILMILVSIFIVYWTKTTLIIMNEHILPIIVLVCFGHLIPIYMIQKTIIMLNALQVSFILLLLPVFALLLQYLDDRIAISMPSIISILCILTFMSVSIFFKLYPGFSRRSYTK